MPDPVTPLFPAVQAANPIERPPVPAGVDDVWALDMLQIRRLDHPSGAKFQMLSSWALGRIVDGDWVRSNPLVVKSANLPDILSPETLASNPEIVEISTPFFTALSAVCKRVGNL